MELYQLRSFVAVAEEGNLSRAAERVFASQPAVSAHIKALEDELGIALFTRTPKGMTPTQAGLLLKEQAEKALRSAEALLDTAKTLQNRVSGPARVGMNTDPVFLKAVTFLSTLMAAHPDLDVQLHEGTSGQLAQRVRAGELEAAFVFGDLSSEFAVLPLQSVDLFVVGPAAWKDRIEGATIEELADMPWIGVLQHCPYHPLMLRRFGPNFAKQATVCSVDDEDTLLAMMAAGKGLCLVREDQAQQAEAQGYACVWRKEAMPIDLSFVTLRARSQDRVIRALTETTMQVWGLA
jgi:DNA-binding transcriptional LysR family regulator